MDIAEEGSLTSRYCLVLEELRAEAVRQMSTVNIFDGHSLQIQSPLDRRSADIEALSSNVETIAGGFAMRMPDLVALGQLDDLHVSPSTSLEDWTSWGQFDSMVRSLNSRSNISRLIGIIGRSYPGTTVSTTCN